MNATLLQTQAGTGKTHLVLAQLAATPTRAAFVTPTHELAEQVQNDFTALGVTTHRWRGGPTKEDACQHADEVEFHRSNGYIAQRGVCERCERRKTCHYLAQYTSPNNLDAQVLIITSWHLRREGVWRLKAMTNRPYVILDEDASSALIAPETISTEHLIRFLLHASVLLDRTATRPADHRSVTDGVDGEQGGLASAATDEECLLGTLTIFRSAAEKIATECGRTKYQRWVSGRELVPELTLDDLCLALDGGPNHPLVKLAYEVVAGGIPLPNIFGRLGSLLFGVEKVHVSRHGVEWVGRPSLPHDRHLLLLDATADPLVVCGVLKRDVHVIRLPHPVEQQAKIIQIMDKVQTRSGVGRDLALEDESWTLMLLSEVTKRHKGQSLLCVTFLKNEGKVRELLEREHGNATVIHYGALRGLNSYGDYKVAVILGRPMPNEVVLQRLAVAAFGHDVLLSQPGLEWGLETVQIGSETWRVRCQRYGDEKWDAVWRHVVVGELMQAIGRLRPLQNACTIYVVTNEPLPRELDVIPVYAGELFPEMALEGHRSDFTARVRKYVATRDKLVGQGKDASHAAICRAMGINERNGLRYKGLADVIGGVSYPIRYLTG